MKSPADEARRNAMNFEAVKYAYRQSKEGIVLSFVVHPNDVPDGLATAPLGSRYVVALVQVDENEQPVKQSAAAQPRQTEGRKSAGAKRDWNELQPQQQAGIRCGEPSFIAFLKEQRSDDWFESADDPAACVRLICGVESRVQLGINHKARVIWKQLDDQYQAWKAVEHA